MSTQQSVRIKFVKANPGVRRMGYGGFWYRCALCGKWCGRPGNENAYIRDDEKMEVDHIRPWSQGGSDELFNLRAVCKPCNRRKSNNMTFSDNVATFGNTIMHPVDSLVATPLRKAARQNKILKGLGITKRR